MQHRISQAERSALRFNIASTAKDVADNVSSQLDKNWDALEKCEHVVTKTVTMQDGRAYRMYMSIGFSAIPPTEVP